MKKILISFILLVSFSSMASAQFKMSEGSRKIATTVAYIENFYVDKIDDDKLSGDIIKAALEKLDPHSSYISADEVKEMNEPLEGNFDGIGISFNMMTDTLYVIETISGGPSEKVGILPGDRIIKVNDTLIAGVKMVNKDIISRLRGVKGTKVNVKVLRKGLADLIDFRITRDKIPIYSLDASYMINDEVGYIKLSRFGATTVDEFKEACKKLQGLGMQDLILDLEGNGGGYLSAAIDLADEFLDKDQIIVYTEGAQQKKQIATATSKGLMKRGKLVIMIDERSASASEIVSGAVQDWDRGVIVGRRSFGKGLVQRQMPLPDGSLIRLTVARYYTPTGRCIQKPYTNGDNESYAMDVIERYNKGEMMSADSIHFPDSLQYTTLHNNRVVYGGGGIMPDNFVPIDTTYYSNYHRDLIFQGILHKTVLSEVDNNRKQILAKYPTIEKFDKDYVISETLLKRLRDAGDESDVKFKEEEFNKSKPIIIIQLKALIARDIYDSSAYYRIINEDKRGTFQRAVDIITNDGAYNKLLSRNKEL